MNKALLKLTLTTPSTLIVLKAIAEHHPSPILISQVAKTIPLHRSNINAKAAELVKLNILQRRIIEITNHKVNPTYRYSLAPGILKEEVIEFCCNCLNQKADTPKPSHNLETVLIRMAEEIASLKKRVSELENAIPSSHPKLNS